MQTPDTKPGDYYVSVIEGGRTALALGPYRDDHAAALARVDEVRRYCVGYGGRVAFASFGTCRLDAADENPAGRLNDVLAEVTV